MEARAKPRAIFWASFAAREADEGRREGRLSRIDDLVAQAQEGAFDTKMCHGLAGKLMCDYIPEELASTVIQMVEQWREASRQSVDVKEAAKKLKV